MRRSQTHHRHGQADLPGSVHRSHARELGALLWVLAAVLSIIVAVYADLSVGFQRLQRPPIHIIVQFSGIFVFFLVFPVIFKVRRRLDVV